MIPPDRYYNTALLYWEANSGWELCFGFFILR